MCPLHSVVIRPSTCAEETGTESIKLLYREAALLGRELPHTSVSGLPSWFPTHLAGTPVCSADVRLALRRGGNCTGWPCRLFAPGQPTGGRRAISTAWEMSTRAPAPGGVGAAFGVMNDGPEGAIARAAGEVNGNAERALTLAAAVGRWLQAPGQGMTAERWGVLMTVATQDLTAARVVEAHTDALAILAEWSADPAAGDEQERTVAGIADQGNTWGVFAAEGPGVRVDARRGGHGWVLTGTKPWCSLAGRLSHALVTAHTDGGRRLFAIRLGDPRVRVAPAGWVARGLTEVVSGPIDLLDCPAVPIGPDGWYLNRPGFAWGGMGVAACWFGGSVGLARTLRDSLATRDPDQVALMHLGACDAALTGAQAVLEQAAAAVDLGRAQGAAGSLWAARVRAVVARAAEDVIVRVGHCLGPAPLALHEQHARRVADLQLYLRQHHAERDEAALGRQVLALGDWR